MSVPGVDHPERRHVYAVTNKHVINGQSGNGSDGSLVLRVNARAGGVDAISTAHAHWERADDDDLAVLPIILPDEIEFWPVPAEMFLDAPLMGMAGIGPGDEVALIGRFIAHDGKQRNKPLARFGNISMMHDNAEPIDGQVGFFIECRSLSGFSGSPVFVYPDLEWRPKQSMQEAVARSNHQEWLLGVCSANMATWKPVCIYDPKSQTYLPKTPTEMVETNSGVSVVIPAWRLLQLLNKAQLVAERQKKD